MSDRMSYKSRLSGVSFRPGCVPCPSGVGEHMTPNPPSETAALYEEPWVLKAPMPVDPNPFPRFRLFRWLP